MKVVTKAELQKLRQTKVEEALAAINTRLTVMWKYDGQGIDCSDLVKSLTPSERTDIASVVGGIGTGWTVEREARDGWTFIVS